MSNNCFANDTINPINVGRLNVAIMAAVMRGVVTNNEMGPSDYTWWGDSAKYYQNEPYNWYAKFWHSIGINGKAYAFGYDDSLDQSPAYTPTTPVTNITIGVGW